MTETCFSLIAAKSVPGYSSEYGDYIEAAVEQGHTIFLKQGSVEAAVNVGDEPYRNVLVEFKVTARD